MNEVELPCRHYDLPLTTVTENLNGRREFSFAIFEMFKIARTLVFIGFVCFFVLRLIQWKETFVERYNFRKN